MLHLPGNVELIDEKSFYTPYGLKRRFNYSKLCTCDFYIRGTEKGDVAPYGAICYEDILNIDHHAPLDWMCRHISSTTIAIDYVKKYGPLPEDCKVLINHTDCDAILSMLIMTGVLEPEDMYNEAAIAADHTGDENDIADLLQAMQKEKDISFSIRNLDALLNGRAIDDEALRLLDKRKDERKKIKKLVDDGKFSYQDSITYIKLDEKIESGLIPKYVPDAKVIIMARPMPEGSAKEWSIHLRLGNEAGEIRLDMLNLPDFGCRWNAGSTKRYGGTDVSPEKFLEIAIEEVNRVYPDILY